MTQEQLTALVLTLLIEVPLVLGVVYLRGWASDRRHWGRLLAVAVAMSLITHPFAWQLNVDVAAHLSATPRILVIETIVSLVEALLLWRWGKLQPWPALGLGFFVNFGSQAIGSLILYSG